MKKNVVWTIFAVLVIILGVFYFTNNDRPDRDYVLVSGNVPLTGDLGVYGEYVRDGANMAYSDLKNQYPNVPEFKFDWQDNRGDLKDTVSIFQKQNIEKPDLYISALKPQTSAITEMVTAENIPHFTWILDVLINPNSNNNLRNWVNFKQEAEVFVDYLKDKDFEKIYIVYVNTDAADDEYEGIVRPELVKRGIKNENIKSESFNFDRTDFADIATKVKQFNPDYVIINGFIPHLVSMTKDFRNFGIIKDGNTIASLDMLDTARLLPNWVIEGMVVAAPSYLVNKTEVINDWESRFESTYGRKPSYHDAYAYDMVKVILEAAQNINFPATSKEWINEIRNIQTTGITGQIKFDEDGSSITPMFPAVYRSGKLIPLE